MCLDRSVETSVLVTGKKKRRVKAKRKGHFLPVEIWGHIVTHGILQHKRREEGNAKSDHLPPLA
jgi:hypothetical protein